MNIRSGLRARDQIAYRAAQSSDSSVSYFAGDPARHTVRRVLAMVAILWVAVTLGVILYVHA